MKSPILILVLALFLGGCAASSKTVVGPDGKNMHMINCSGEARSWEACYEKAGELCGSSGYDIVSSEDTQTPTGMTYQHSKYYSTSTMNYSTTRRLMINCK